MNINGRYILLPSAFAFLERAEFLLEKAELSDFPSNNPDEQKTAMPVLSLSERKGSTTEFIKRKCGMPSNTIVSVSGCASD